MQSRGTVYAAFLILTIAAPVDAEPIPPRTADVVLAPGPKDPVAVTISSDGYRIMGVNLSGSAAVIRAKPDGTLSWTHVLPPLSGLTDVMVDQSSGVYVYSSILSFSLPTFPFPPAPPTPRPFLTLIPTDSPLAARSVEIGLARPATERMSGPLGSAIDTTRGLIYVLYATSDPSAGSERLRAEIYDRNLVRTNAILLNRQYAGVPLAIPTIGADSNGALWITQFEFPPPPAANYIGVERFSSGLTAPTTKFYAIADPVIGFARVATDPRGGVAIAGDLAAAGPQDHFRRVDTNGFSPALQLPGFAHGPMAIDSDGNLFVGGTDPGNGLPAIVKLSAGNAKLWSPPYLNLPADRMAEALGITAQGRLHVVGTVFGPGPGDERIFWSEYGEASSSCTITALPAPEGTVIKTAQIGAKVLCNSIPKDDVTVRFATSTSPSGSTLSSTFTVTNSSGVAVSTLTFGIMTGTYTVTATCDECTPTSITLAAHARLFMAVEVSTPVLKPVPRSGIIGIDQRTEVKVRLFGVGGSTDVVAGYPVVLESTPVAGSGGHSHHLNRPRGSLLGTGLTLQPDGIAGTSDSSGTIVAVFISTYFGGIELLTARSTIDVNFTPSVSTSITVDVGDLVLLPAATFYTKVGGTTFHRSPPGSATDNNHYATTEFAAIISSVSAQFKAKFPSRTVRINDMSLPVGGLFDIDGGWRSPHTFHRLGTSCDYNLDTGLSMNLGTVEEVFLKKQFQAHVGITVRQESNHWHIYLAGGGP
jgi:hypothetical protein